MPAAADTSPFRAIRESAARAGATLTAAQIDQFARYAELLLERNRSVNLTAITAPEEVAVKHVLDSLSALGSRRWTGRERIVDVGAGAGFPGLALRIALPGSRLLLVESVGKKARFLEEAVAVLGLDGVEVRNARAEELRPADRERFDVGTARAVGSLGADFEYLFPYLRIGGDAIVWKGRLDAELAGGRRALAALGGGAERI
ncbi:MAG: 16S rRNA (guanine(527)-N(7))-methyltransferase RsmG, partial [Chloroflexi bacterium]|nr:16S rRNA (guanine(527)-N(7))-methyltransferase RsmG [Chloroflexota bacterium]